MLDTTQQKHLLALSFCGFHASDLDAYPILKNPGLSAKNHLPASRNTTKHAKLRRYLMGKQPIAEQIESALLWESSQQSNHLVFWGSTNYPNLLAEISAAPLILFVAGNLDLLHVPAISIIGSRDPSQQGIQTARIFASKLAEQGLCIISGLAKGIDSAAHTGALAAHKTVAVMGTGIDSIYPSQNKNLAEEIQLHGALVSEFPLGTPPRANHFPRRNRVISGLSSGTLVVEASLHSGSLITARYALEHNREVCAVPGSIFNPVTKGCHQLIREGAVLVTEPAEVLDAVHYALENWIESSKDTPIPYAPDTDKGKILACFDISNILSIEQLIDQTGIDSSTLIGALTMLEIEDYLQASAGGYKLK